MKKIILAGLIVVAIGAIWWFYGGKKSQDQTNLPTRDENATSLTVVYNGDAFEPKTLIIKVGETVEFKNASTTQLEVESGTHPTHKGYPTNQGDCNNTHFGSCSPFASGTSYSFRFDEIGTWQYHNHLDPNQTGTIIVQ